MARLRKGENPINWYKDTFWYKLYMYLTHVYVKKDFGQLMAKTNDPSFCFRQISWILPIIIVKVASEKYLVFILTLQNDSWKVGENLIKTHSVQLRLFLMKIRACQLVVVLKYTWNSCPFGFFFNQFAQIWQPWMRHQESSPVPSIPENTQPIRNAAGK